MNSLARLSQAVQLLSEAKSLDEVTHVHSMAQTAEEYARAERLGDEAERHAREIRVRAARKAGALLKEMRERGERAARGDWGSVARSKILVAHEHLPPRLSDLGVTHDQSSRWQRIAAVPEETFERAIAEGRGEDRIARLASQPPRPTAIRREHGKRSGPTLKQSLRGLQQAGVQIQGLAEALDGQMLGDWSQLYEIPEAARWFEVIEENLRVVNARLKRVLRERRATHGSEQDAG